MQPGDVTALFLPDGRFVTRWKEQRANSGNAIFDGDEPRVRNTLANKFPPPVLRNIGVFKFLGWADNGTSPDGRERMPPPVVAFGSVLSKAEVRNRLGEVVAMVDQSQDDGPFWVELFVRSKTKSGTEDGDRFKQRGPGRRQFRRD